MAKRRSRDSNLPLFDLPLREAAERQTAEQSVVVPVPPPLDLAEDPERAAAQAVVVPDAPSMPKASDSLSFDPFDPEPKPQPVTPGPSQSPETTRAGDLAWDEDDEPMLFTEEDLLPVGDPDGPDAVADNSESGNGGALVQDRLLGGVADLTLHLAVLGAMVLAVLAMGVPVGLENWPPFALFALLFSFLYSVIPLAFWGQTPGMAWVGHVARTEADEPLTFGQTVNRWLGAVLTAALVGLPLLLAISGRSLADRLSHSVTQQT